MRTDRWRYIEWNDGVRELYDYETDPEEDHNLADRPESQSVLRELQKLVAAQ